MNIFVNELLESMYVEGAKPFTAEHWKQFGKIRHAVLSRRYIILCYGKGANYNPYESVCRGLILDYVARKVVAYPFDKFFNYAQGGRFPSTHGIESVTEKMDGSLGVYFLDDGIPRITTKAAFDSPMATWATEYYNKHYKPVEGFTLIFEIICRHSRVVVPYSEEKLTLIGARDLSSGELIPYYQLAILAQENGFNLVPHAPTEVNSTASVLAAMNQTGYEGYVVRYTSGEMFKFKTDWYQDRHRGTNQKEKVIKADKASIAKALASGALISDFGEHSQLAEELEQEVNFVLRGASAIHREAETISDPAERGKFVVAVAGDMKGIVFMAFKGLDIMPKVWEIIIKRYESVKS